MTPFLNLQSNSRALVLAPHPDDESLALGGLLQKISEAGGQCKVLFLTNGENNPWPQRAIERHWKIGSADKERWGKRRQLEAKEALTELGIPETAITFWNFPDQRLTDRLLSGDDEPINRLVKVLDEWQPSLLVAPSPMDLHPDHSAAAVFTRLALGRRKITATTPFHIDYLVHSPGKNHRPAGLPLVLTERQREQKRLAIQHHTSQLLLRPNLVKFADRMEDYINSEEIRNLRYYPVYNVALTANNVMLDLKLSFHIGAFGRAVLYLATFLPGRPAKVVSITIPQRRNRDVDVRDAVHGDVVSSAHLQGGHSRFRIQFPKTVLGGADVAYVKVKRRFGFFDEAGWCEIELSR